MSRILLVHWNPEEARERARELTSFGHAVETLSRSETSDLRQVRSSPPELFLIDLGRLPSHGREIAGYFRRQKATRTVPIVFVGGDRERVESARRLLPDAHFAQWKNIRATIRSAVRQPPREPVVPGTMDAYSASPLPKKLGIRENYRVALSNAPAHFERQLEPWPEGAEIVTDPGRANVAVLFVASAAELARDLRALSRILPQKSALWVAWPKQSSGIATDLKDTVIREFGLGEGLVDYKVCAIDRTWSALCFARRAR
jgi:CheY-like chemotaxis protein